MNDNILWGGIGILLAVGGAAVIGLEMTQADPLTQIYGVGVIFAALLTILIIAPSFRTS